MNSDVTPYKISLDVSVLPNNKIEKYNKDLF